MKTKEYRKREFEKINTVYNDYKTKVKFIKPNGETNFLDKLPESIQLILIVIFFPVCLMIGILTLAGWFLFIDWILRV